MKIVKKISNDDIITKTGESSQEGIGYSDEDEPQLLIDLNPKGMCVIIRFISGLNFQILNPSKKQ